MLSPFEADFDADNAVARPFVGLLDRIVVEKVELPADDEESSWDSDSDGGGPPPALSAEQFGKLLDGVELDVGSFVVFSRSTSGAVHLRDVITSSSSPSPSSSSSSSSSSSLLHFIGERPAQLCVYRVIEATPLLSGRVTASTVILSLAAVPAVDSRRRRGQRREQEQPAGPLRVERLRFPLHRPQPPPDVRDVNSEIGVSLQTLKSLQLLSGSWVVLESVDHPSLPRAVGQVFAIDPPTDNFLWPTSLPTITERWSIEHRHPLLNNDDDTDGNDVVFVSPQVIHNAGWQHYVQSSNSNNDEEEEEEEEEEDGSGPFLVRLRGVQFVSHQQRRTSALLTQPHYEVPMAARVVVSRVQLASVVRASGYVRALRQYFQGSPDVRRVLGVGHVFCVRCSPPFAVDGRDDEQLLLEDDVNLQDLSMDDGHDQTVFYKVVDVRPLPSSSHTDDNNNDDDDDDDDDDAAKKETQQLFYVSPEHTALEERQVIQSRVPAQLSLPLPGGLDDYVAQLCELIEPCFDPLAQRLGIRVPVLLHGPVGCGKRTIVERCAGALGLHLFEFNCYELLQESGEANTIQALDDFFQIAPEHAPCLLLLRHVGALEASARAGGGGIDPQIARVLRDLLAALPTGDADKLVTVVATSDSKSLLDCSATLRASFTHTLAVAPPDAAQRRDMLHGLLCAAGACCSFDVDLEHVATNTASFVLGDVAALLARAQELAWHAAVAGAPTTRALPAVDRVVLTPPHFDAALAHMRRHPSRTAVVGTPNIPNVKWNDVGGLDSVKREILDTIQLPLQRPELFAAGLRQRSGVLLYGPPGCGKTLMAKAVATECTLNFLSVKGPELINMYVGESEKNVRDVFSRARAARPCIIFFDELDSLAPKRGKGSDSGGVMDRIVSQLLAELDGMTSSPDVFVIGATNRPDLLDDALLRPGRFDRIVYLGVSSHPDGQEQVLRALTRKFAMHPDVDLSDIAARCPPNLTGADLYALCSDAYLNAIKQCIGRAATATAATSSADDNSAVVVTARDFVTALEQLSPSLSLDELAEYESIRQQSRKS